MDDALPMDANPMLERLDRAFPEALIELPSGARVAVRTAGERGAPAVVLLHGIGSGAATWLEVAEALSGSARVIAWDAPGYGASTAAAPDAEVNRDRGFDRLSPNGPGSGSSSAPHTSVRPDSVRPEPVEAPLPTSPVRAEPVEGPEHPELVEGPEPVEGPLRANAYAFRLGELLAALGIDRCILVGHSLGALIATAFATGPGASRITRLVLLSPARGYGADDRGAERERVRTTRLGQLASKGIAGIAEDAPGRMLGATADAAARAWVRWNAARLNPAGYADAVDLLCEIDIASARGHLAMPCEVHVGEADVVTPPAACRAIADALGASFATIANAGHAVAIEQPHEVARRVRAALEAGR